MAPVSQFKNKVSLDTPLTRHYDEVKLRVSGCFCSLIFIGWVRTSLLFLACRAVIFVYGQKHEHSGFSIAHSPRALLLVHIYFHALQN